MNTSPTIRLFVSSTFSDLKAERDALQREVFPRLKQLCLSRALRFQAIDLRWGISEEAGRDNRTMRICLRELRRCQQDRPKPNFLILLGDRYGWRPLPFEIVPDEFEALRDHLTADERRLIEWSETKSDNCAAWREGNPQPRVGWYRLDRNAVPSDEQPPGIYVLQPRKLDVPAGATDKQKEELAKHESADWTRIESEIHAAFARAIQRLGWAEDDPRRIKYEASATHQEILHGALNLKVDDARRHVHAFTRTIRLPAGQSAHKDFVDRLPEGSEDRAARAQHGQLRDKLLSHLTKDNLHEYTVDWREEGKFTADDLKEFCEQAWKQLSAVVQQQIAALAKVPPDEQEEQAHQDFGKERCRRFVGRSEPLESIAAYLKWVWRQASQPASDGGIPAAGVAAGSRVTGPQGCAPPQPGCKPLAVIGPSGSGKSAVMAKAVEKVTSGGGKAEIICRFIGATPASSDLIQLLRNLVGEIRKRYPVATEGRARHSVRAESSREEPTPTAGTESHALPTDAEQKPNDSEIPFEYNPLISAFHGALKRPTAERPLFLFLDALDQLTASHNAHSLAWLPNSLTPHVRLVVSAALPAETSGALTPSLSHPMGEGGRRPGEGDSSPATRHSSLSHDPRATIIAALTSRLDEQHRITLAPLTAADGDQMLANWLADAQRTLQPPQRQAILETFKVEGSPLWLRTAADEAARLASWQPAPTFAPTTPGLLGQVLDRLSREEEHGDKLVSRTLSYLACARHGLAEDEILDILSADIEVMADFRRRSPNSPKVDSLPVAVWVRLHGDLAFYLAEHQAQGASLLGFYHRSFLEAVTAHCFASREARETRHQHMSVYFLDCAKGLDPAKEWETDAVRGFAECVFHLVKAGQHERAAALVSNFPFLLHKLRVGLLQGVFEDYEMLRNEAPTEVVKTLEIWAVFFRQKAHILRRGNEEWPAHKILLQLAVEHADDSPLTISAEQWLAEGHCDWLWLRRISRLPHAQKNPCLAVLEGHTTAVKSSLVLPDGRVFSWSYDKTLRLWDGQNGACLSVLEGHTDEVIGAFALSDGRLLSWASWQDKTLRVWASQGGECLAVLKGHTSYITGALVLADGRLLSWSGDKTLRLWDTQTGVCLAVLEGHTDGVTGALMLPDGRLLSWAGDKTLRLWDGQSGAHLAALRGHSDGGVGALVLADGRVMSWSWDKTLRLWDEQSATCVAVLRGHAGWILGVLVLADGRLVSWANDGTLRLWDAQSRECLAELRGHPKSASGALELDDGRLLSWSWDGTLRLWDGQSGACQAVLEGHTSEVSGALALSDGRLLSWSRDKTLRLWDGQSGACLAVLEGHTDGVTGALMLPDGRLLSWAGDGTLRLWNGQNYGSMGGLEGHSDAAHGVLALADGRLLSWSDDKTLRFWDAESGICLGELEGHTGSVYGALELTEGRLLSWSEDKTLRVWDRQGGACLTVLKGHTSYITGALVLADGRLLSWSGDKTLRVWDAQTGVCLAVLEGHTASVTGALMLPDGRLLSWAGDGTLRLWNGQSYNCEDTLRLHELSVFGALALPDGRLLSWGNDGILQLWGGQLHIPPLEGHTDSVYGAQVLPDGRLLSWSRDKTLRLWDGHHGACLETVTEAQVARRHPEWLHARAEANNPENIVGAFFVRRSAHLRHKSISSILATWEADSDAGARCLLPDGTAVVAQANGQVCILKLHYGNRHVSLAEVEQLLRSEGRINPPTHEASA